MVLPIIFSLNYVELLYYRPGFGRKAGSSIPCPTCLALYTCLIRPASLPYCVLGRPLAIPSPLTLCSKPEGYPGAFGNGLSYRTGASSGKAWPVRGSCHAWGCLEKAFRPEKSCSRAAGSFFSCHRARRRRYRGEVLPAGQTKGN